MKCRFVKEIFRNRDNGFCIFVYHTEDGGVPEAARDAHYKGKGFRFTATGTGLPDMDKMEADLQGKWVKSKYGLQLQVESHGEILPQTKEGIQGYLSSGMIRGIGPSLGSDLMEPFRVLVDRMVCSMRLDGFEHEQKMKLVNLLNQEVIMEGKHYIVLNAIKRYVKSVFDALNDADIALLTFCSKYEL